MLVLGRHEDESIIVVLPDGGEVEIKVVQISAGKVRLGVVAPKDVPVHRLEVWRSIARDAVRVAKTRPAIELAPRVVDSDDAYGHAEVGNAEEVVLPLTAHRAFPVDQAAGIGTLRRAAGAR